MRSQFASQFLAILFTVSLAACGSPGSGGGGDLVSDVAADAVADAGGDAVADAGKDAALDSAADSAADAGPDAVQDAVPDTAVDAAADADALAPGCCNSAGGCPPSAVCALTPFTQGVCLPAPAAGRCWDAAGCGPNEACVSPTFCPCDVDCGQITQAGTCVSIPPCCATDAECGAGNRCAPAGGDKGVCKPAATAAGTCWNGADCESGEVCVGAIVCPCTADCDQADAPGACAPVATGCCAADADCPDDICFGQVCLTPPPADFRCWRDKDCPSGKTCHGAAVCPCGADCELDYEGPGVCVVEASPCTAVEESWVEEICDAASVVIWNGTACVTTCPGCCGTGGFSDLVFGDNGMAACQAACAP
jgi:hypothetical protein